MYATVLTLTFEDDKLMKVHYVWVFSRFTGFNRKHNLNNSQCCVYEALSPVHAEKLLIGEQTKFHNIPSMTWSHFAVKADNSYTNTWFSVIFKPRRLRGFQQMKTNKHSAMESSKYSKPSMWCSRICLCIQRYECTNQKSFPSAILPSIYGKPTQHELYGSSDQ